MVGEESRREYEWRRREGLRERGGEPIPSNSHAKRAAAVLDGPETGGREGLGGAERKEEEERKETEGVVGGWEASESELGERVGRGTEH